MKPTSLLLVFAAAACEAAPSSKLQDQTSNPPTPPPTVGTREQTLADCTPKELWRAEVSSYGWRPAAPRFSPNGGLVARGDAITLGGTTYLRVSNGAHVATVQEDFVDRDRRWERGVRIGDLGVSVETVFEGSVIFSDPQAGRSDAAISEDGEQLAILKCEVTSRAATLEVYRLLTGEKTASIALDDVCDALWTESTARVVVLDEAHVLVATNARLHRVELAGGKIERSREFPQILTFGFDPQSGAIGVVTTEAKLHRLSSDLELEEEAAIEVPLVTLNRNIYSSLVLASPVAWSPDGALFAHLDAAEQGLVVEKAGAVHAMIPAIESPSPWDPREILNEPVGAAAFSPDGKLLAVAYEHEFAMWGCEDVVEEEHPAITVRLEGPTRVKVGEAATFLATDLDGRDFHGHQFLVDGTAVGIASEQRELRWTAETAGRHQIAVHLDDGLRTGDAALEVIAE